MSDNANSVTTSLNNSIDSDVNNMTSPIKIKGGFKNLTKEKEQIGGRINNSIAAFTDPIGYQSSILKGGNNNNNKTKRLVKRNKKSKSRRVRFSF